MAKRKAKASIATINSGPKVDFSRNELNLLLPAYYMIRDAVIGEQAIKGMIGTNSGMTAGVGDGGGLPLTTTNIVVTRAARYLPQPNAADKSAVNLERYKQYITRAVWYNVTARTLEGMAGQIFLRDPIVSLPSQLQILLDNADGSGLTLEQTANRCVRHCIAYGRTGILVDYPVTNGAVTAAQIASGEIQPTITVYNPWDIINWRVEMRGAKKVLTFVVLREVLDEEGDDGFQLSAFEQYRVLSLDSETNTHTVEIYKRMKSGSGAAGFQLADTSFPTDGKGQPMTEIPFHFVGSENNDVLPNKPPLYDLASLNIAHYRNSADYEESCFIVGQPTPVLSGLSEDWVKNILGGTVPLGARSSIALPVGATASLLQAQPNSMPIEAMKEKEQQMVSIGAKLVQLQRTARTATQQIIETTSESSPLTHISKNVSAALVWALGVAADFVGAAKDTIVYKLNKDFDLTSMTADDQNAVIKQWQSAAISFSEMRTVLRKAGTANLEDDEARKLIEADIAAGLIPDPAQEQVPPPLPPAVPDANAPSDAGGPQPKRMRRQGSPQGGR